MVRLSFALDTTAAEVDAAATILADVALELRKKYSARSRTRARCGSVPPLDSRNFQPLMRAMRH